jgi:kynurenine formamidase
MDHIGTQFGPPAHLNPQGATISDIPPTVVLRPLVVVNVAPKVAADPGYQATVEDVKDWERSHGTNRSASPRRLFRGSASRLKNNFAQAEGVANLPQVPESGALIAPGFAKFAGGTGGFARYVAIAPRDWPRGDTIAARPGAPLDTLARPLSRGPDGVLRDSP